MTRPRALFILTSQPKTSQKQPGGWYLPELAHPYAVLSAKADIVVASPKGDFYKNHFSIWKNTTKLEDFVGRASKFSAIFYVGGYGPMFDLVDNTASQTLIREFWESGKIVSAMCHGPAALYNVQLSDGSLLVKDKTVTAVTTAEEKAFGTEDAVPFLPEEMLTKVTGGRIIKAEPGKESVAIDGRLITGQNPASASGVAVAIANALDLI